MVLIKIILFELNDFIKFLERIGGCIIDDIWYFMKIYLCGKINIF